jgi:hypothetical protein
MTPAGWRGEDAEIYLYDTLPGGAGFVRRVGMLGLRVFEEALRILEDCPDGCDRSCYRCLRSYKNKFEHDLLDRHLGASLLRFALNGTPPALDTRRLEQSCDLLFQDLQRQAPSHLIFRRSARIEVPGLGEAPVPILAARADGARFAVGLHGPLTPGYPQSEALRQMQEHTTAVRLHLVDELVVRRNLPRATSDLMATLSEEGLGG